MNTINVSFIDGDADTVTAEYYVIEDGWVTFKTTDHKAIAAYPAPRVASIKTSPKEDDVLRPVLELHNADGTRWVGFPRADRQESYCTECNKTAPCPTIAALK